MLLPLAMIDPGAGAGGAIIMLAIIVSVIAGVIHFFSRYYFAICLGAAATQFMLFLIPWILLDVLDPNSGDRMYFSMRLLPWTFLLPLVGSAYTGLLARVLRWLISSPEDE